VSADAAASLAERRTEKRAGLDGRADLEAAWDIAMVPNTAAVVAQTTVIRMRFIFTLAHVGQIE
jgi:hypothetical protein